MSSFKKFDGMLDDLQKQASGKKTLAGSAIEDFLSIAGYETPGGGGGASVIFVPITDTGVSYDTPNGSGDYSLMDLFNAFSEGAIIRFVLEKDYGYVQTVTGVSTEEDEACLWATWGSQFYTFFPIDTPDQPGLSAVYD